MTTANNQSITTSETTVTVGLPCTTFSVSVTASSAASCLVNIPGLHQSGEYWSVDAGQVRDFRVGTGGIHTVYLKTSSGTATVHYGPVARL